MIITGESISSMVDMEEEKKAEDVANTPTPNQDEGTSFSSKPFFIMDWLEKIIPKDLEVAQRCLYTPQKDADEADIKQPLNAVTRQLFASGPSSLDAPEPTISPFTEESHFHKKSIAIGNAWNAKGLQKAQKDQWKVALCCWRNALEVRLQVLGDNHLDVANTYNNIGIAQGKLGQYDDAVASLHRAQQIRKNLLGENHTEVAATLHNIGNVHQQKGDFVKAVEFFSMSKQLQEMHLGKNHVQVARATIAIGHTNFQAGEWEHALRAYSDALETLRRAGVGEEEEEIQNLKEDMEDAEVELAKKA